MPFVSRRALVDRILAVATFGATAGAVTAKAQRTGSDPLPSSSPDGQGEARWIRLSQAIDAVRSSVGASLVGFGRPDGGSVTRTVQGKLLECPSIVDFGAIADDKTDNADAIQKAIDAMAAAGGGVVHVPAGTFLLRAMVELRSHVTLQGCGSASILHCVNTARVNALGGLGRSSNRLSGIAVRYMTVLGDARFTDGKPNIINGSGLIFDHADDCEVSGVTVVGFSDNGISFLNGNRNSVTNCLVKQTAQGISFTASDISVTGNVAIGNRIIDTGEYNGLHLEGGFGGKSSGEVRHTTLSGNVISGCWEAGINIELAPYTACVGNTVERAGQGRTTVAMGIKVYGGYRSAICGNTVIGASGDGIVIGANSSECSVTGNVTAGNGGSLLLTDSGAQVSNDVAIETNSFTEGDVRLFGNVRLRNRTLGLNFVNRNSPDPHTLDWYEEGRFILTQQAGGSAASCVSRDATFTRIGNIVCIVLGIDGRGGEAFVMEGLPYPAAVATPMLATLRRAGPADVADTVEASVSGRRLIFRMTSQPRTTVRDGERDQSWHVTLSGQYLTTP